MRPQEGERLMIDRYFTQSKILNRFQNGPIGPLFPSVHHSTGGPWLCGVFDSAHGPYSGSTREVVEGPPRRASGSEPGPRRVISWPPARPAQEQWPLASAGTLFENHHRAFEATAGP
jgi:hypothetical protein